MSCSRYGYLRSRGYKHPIMLFCPINLSALIPVWSRNGWNLLWYNYIHALRSPRHPVQKTDFGLGTPWRRQRNVMRFLFCLVGVRSSKTRLSLRLMNALIWILVLRSTIQNTYTVLLLDSLECVVILVVQYLIQWTVLYPWVFLFIPRTLVASLPWDVSVYLWSGFMSIPRACVAWNVSFLWDSRDQNTIYRLSKIPWTR